MDQVSIIFSALTHDYKSMLWFWLFATLPVGTWQMFYFPSKKQLTEKELEEISSDFYGINADYIGFSIFAIFLLIGLPLLLLAPSLDKWAMLRFRIKFYPSITIINAGYGIYQSIFALIKGVYPMARSLTYIYDDPLKIRRIAKSQLILSIFTIVFVVLFFFATVR